MIIDGHAHVVGENYGSVDTLIVQMDQAGIDKAVLVPGGMIDVRKMTRYIAGVEPVRPNVPNNLVEDAIARFPDRFFGFFCVNPHEVSAVDGFVTAIHSGKGFCGLKLAPIVHRFSLTSSIVKELAKVCEENEVPFYSHVVYQPGATTEKFGLLAEAFPQTTFILGHMGFGPADVDAIDLAVRHDNVFLETSGGSFLIIKKAMDRVGPGKIIFGSEFPMYHPGPELHKISLLDQGDAFDQMTYGNLIAILERTPLLKGPLRLRYNI